jgi:predicted secreted Zn-dependent protease
MHILRRGSAPHSRLRRAHVGGVVSRSAMALALALGAIGPAASVGEASGAAAGAAAEGSSLTPHAPTVPGPAAAPMVAASSFVPLPKLSFTIPKTAVKYFGIRGSTYAELMDSLQQAAAGACGSIDYAWAEGDLFTAACAKARPGARTLTTSRCVGGQCTSTCRITAVTGTETVYLPRWVAPSMVPASLLGWWKVVATDLRNHEATHVSIFYRWLATLKTEAVGKSCGAWNTIYKRWAAREGAAQEAFDRKDYAAQDWPLPPDDAY